MTLEATLLVPIREDPLRLPRRARFAVCDPLVLPLGRLSPVCRLLAGGRLQVVLATEGATAACRLINGQDLFSKHFGSSRTEASSVASSVTAQDSPEVGVGGLSNVFVVKDQDS